MNKVIGWFAVAIAFVFATAYPLLLLGFPKEVIWPVSLACGGLLLASRPGGTVEIFLTKLLVHGITFSLWCILGIGVLIVLNIFGADLRPPESLFLIGVIGVIGAVRTAIKENEKDK
ncbi:MAG: hypothetical protein FJY56_19745 [Betaproteobacteria bacterium]|nr:hypothetical protein [Betaproteobacteria bacterium]